MKLTPLAIVLFASVAWTGQAGAGPCTDRIAALDKAMSSMDAGSGPTTKPGDTSSTTQGGTDNMAKMNAKVGDTATSPADVRTQTQGTGSANKPVAGAPDPKAISDKMAAAKAADAKGDAAGCTKALDEAEALNK